MVFILQTHYVCLIVLVTVSVLVTTVFQIRPRYAAARRGVVTGCFFAAEVLKILKLNPVCQLYKVYLILIDWFAVYNVSELKP